MVADSVFAQSSHDDGANMKTTDLSSRHIVVEPEAPSVPLPEYVQRIRKILSLEGVTDIHVTEGKILWFRKDGSMYPVKDMVPLEGITAISTNLFTLPSWGRGNWSVAYGTKRLRIRFSASQNRKQMFIRILPDKIPMLEELGYDEIFGEQLVDKGTIQGILLVAGETGSGKSTLLASILQEYINRYPIHVVTVEDPIEYIVEERCGEISQREIPDDVKSFDEAVINVLREDPDIIFFGEMRDPDTAIAALTAAETGHMVLGTVHAPDIPGIIDRLLGLLGKINDAPLRLSQAMLGGVILTLDRKPNGEAIRECKVLWIDDEHRKSIREKRTYDLKGNEVSYTPNPKKVEHSR